MFYFAAESDEELAAWLDCLSMATFALDIPTLKTSASEGNVNFFFPSALNVFEWNLMSPMRMFMVYRCCFQRDRRRG